MNVRTSGCALSEPRSAVSVWRWLAASIALAVVVGVAEPLVRFGAAAEIRLAPQLMLAVLVNVALLGLISVVFVGIALVLLWLLKTASPTWAFRVRPYVGPVMLGVLVTVFLLQTDGVGFVRQAGVPGSVVAVVAGVAAFAWMRWRGNSGGLGLSAFARVGALVAWLVCVGASGVSVAKTDNHVQSWLDVGDAGTASHAAHLPNIVLVVLDTLRADRVGVYGGGGLTPRLDEFASSSIVYTHALATAPWTLPTHASLFTGLYPEEHGVSWGHYKLEDDVPVLAELMRSRGYETFAVSNNWLLSEANGFARGFDSFIETSRDPVLSRWRLALQCGLAGSVLRWIGPSSDAGHDAGSAWTNWLLRSRFQERGSAHRPFFAFVNYFEPHDPYRPPLRYLTAHLTADQRRAYQALHQSERRLAAHACGVPGVFDDEEISLLSDLYDAEVAYQDEAVGEFFDILEDNGLLDDSWVIVTSDHGELFGEQDGLYHTAGSHYKLLHVPLIVRPPGGVPARRLDAPVQPVDIFVTLLEVAGADVPASVRRAYRLPLDEEDPAERRLCVAQTHGASIAGLAMAQRTNLQADLTRWLSWVDSVYDGRHLLEIDSRGPRGLYDVAADPRMGVNRLPESSQLVSTMIDAFDDWKMRKAYGDRRWRWARR